MRRIYEFYICTISSALDKRRGKTKVFPLLLHAAQAIV